jgi:hypothetical protein
VLLMGGGITLAFAFPDRDVPFGRFLGVVPLLVFIVVIAYSVVADGEDVGPRVKRRPGDAGRGWFAFPDDFRL